MEERRRKRGKIRREKEIERGRTGPLVPKALVFQTKMRSVR